MGFTVLPHNLEELIVPLDPQCAPTLGIIVLICLIIYNSTLRVLSWDIRLKVPTFLSSLWCNLTLSQTIDINPTIKAVFQ
jgi:hypothetical protein